MGSGANAASDLPTPPVLCALTVKHNFPGSSAAFSLASVRYASDFLSVINGSCQAETHQDSASQTLGSGLFSETAVHVH